MTDEEFFTTFPDRQARIRKPVKFLEKDRQRAMTYQDENEGEFLSLGPHNANRRRLIVWRVPEGNPFYDPMKRKLLKIPMLLFSDETVEDRDDVILPILHQIMQTARAS